MSAVARFYFIRKRRCQIINLNERKQMGYAIKLLFYDSGCRDYKNYFITIVKILQSKFTKTKASNDFPGSKSLL